MKMFKKIALSLIMLLVVAILSYSWAEKVREPERYTINGNITVYQDVADDIVRRIKNFLV